MGRSRNRSKYNKNGRANQDHVPIAVKKSSQRWDALPTTNLAFVEYYKNQQKIVSTEEEWDQLFSSFRTDLPTTFRVTGSKKNAAQLNKIIRDVYVPFLSNVKINDELVPPPQTIQWYPHGLAWEFRASKQLIRKSLELKKFQNFLVYETESGNLSRQEAVSMIPPLLLDVQSHHYVLDTCAAPGSKTAQLVESLHHADSGLIPRGLVIANDSDYKRSHLLVHQSLRRLPSPSTMITNHDASRFPTLSMASQKLYFDRILCDVPCSGDGTLRKNGGIWRDWTPANGIGLHGLQLRILSRAISLLKPGGRIVYSTCSLNPLENEAVVSAALLQFPSMKIKDVSDCLPNLVRRPGLTSWKVTTRDPNSIRSVSSPSDLPELPANKKYPPTLWPSGKESELGLQHCLRIYPHLQDTGGFFVAVLEKADSASPLNKEPPARSGTNPPKSDVKSPGIGPNQEISQSSSSHGGPETDPVKENLSVCPSIEPSDGNSFKREVSIDEEIAWDDQPVKKKVKIESSIAEDIPKIDNVSQVGCHNTQLLQEDGSEPAVVERYEPLNNPFKEEPHVYLKPGNEEIKECVQYFDISPSFPVDNLLVRNAEGVAARNIYLTSSVVREVIENNSHTRLRLICCGVKVFGRQDPSASMTKEINLSKATANTVCKWRVVSDGIEYFRPFMGSKRIIKCHLSTLKQLMKQDQQYPLIEDLEDSDFKSQVRSIQMGSCVAEIFDGDQKNDGGVVPLDLMVGLWISKSSVNLMVDKKERQVLSLRLWGEDLTTHSKEPKSQDHQLHEDETGSNQGKDNTIRENNGNVEEPKPADESQPLTVNVGHETLAGDDSKTT